MEASRPGPTFTGPAMLPTFFFIAWAISICFLIVLFFNDRRGKRHLIKTLEARPIENDQAFARHWLGESDELAGVAVRLRKLLAQDLDLPGDRLKPDDRLDEELDAELIARPEVFEHIEDEFGIATNVMDYGEHIKDLERLTTFRDLVRYVDSRPPQKDGHNDWI